MAGANKGKPKRSRAELLSFLNSALARHDAAATRDGTSRWVVIAGLGAVGWEALKELLAPPHSGVYSILVMVYITQVCLVMATTFYKWVTPQQWHINANRVIDKIWFHAAARELSISIGIDACYLCLGVYVFWGHSHLLQVFNAGLWGIPLLVEFTALKMSQSKMNWHITQSIGKTGITGVNVASILLAGGALITLSYLVAMYFAGDFQMDADAVTLGVLASTAAFLLTLLGGHRSSLLLSQSLEALIVAITFNQITLKDAYVRTEAMFVGGDLDDALTGEVKAFIRTVDTHVRNGVGADRAAVKSAVDSQYNILLAQLQTLVLVQNSDKAKIDPLKERVKQKYSEFTQAFTQAPQPAG